MSKIEILKTDITEFSADAIVNAANGKLLAGGGVCGAVYKKAGFANLSAACKKIGHCDVGCAVITPGFKLPAKFIIHAVGPKWIDGEQGEPALLYSTYQAALTLALENDCHSIGFPLISAGIFRYPVSSAWKKALESCFDFIGKHPDYDIHIVFAVIDEKIKAYGEKVLAEKMAKTEVKKILPAASENLLNHHGTIKLETQRLLLRRFTPDDAEEMFRNWASDEKVTEFLTWPAHADIAVTKAVLYDWVQQYERADVYHWGIVLKETGELIGDICAGTKEKILTATLGWCLSAKCWGRGYMPEAAGAVLAYLFETVCFERVEAVHDVENPKSGRVMQKIGMTKEGLLRKRGVNNRGIIDEVWYSLLKEEYEQMTAAKETESPSADKEADEESDLIVRERIRTAAGQLKVLQNLLREGITPDMASVFLLQIQSNIEAVLEEADRRELSEAAVILDELAENFDEGGNVSEEFIEKVGKVTELFDSI